MINNSNASESAAVNSQSNVSAEGLINSEAKQITEKCFVAQVLDTFFFKKDFVIKTLNPYEGSRYSGTHYGEYPTRFKVVEHEYSISTDDIACYCRDNIKSSKKYLFFSFYMFGFLCLLLFLNHTNLAKSLDPILPLGTFIVAVITFLTFVFGLEYILHLLFPNIKFGESYRILDCCIKGGSFIQVSQINPSWTDSIRRNKKREIENIYRKKGHKIAHTWGNAGTHYLDGDIFLLPQKRVAYLQALGMLKETDQFVYELSGPIQEVSRWGYEWEYTISNGGVVMKTEKYICVSNS